MATYPSTLPAPQSLTISVADRRAKSVAGITPMKFRARQSEYVAMVDAVFVYSPSQSRAFMLWSMNEMNQGGDWFLANSWPRAAEYGKEFRFSGPLRFSHLGRGYQRMTAQLEMRGLR